MTNKKSLFLCFISLLFFSSYGMDQLTPPPSPSKRLPNSPSKSPHRSPSKKRPLENPSEPDTKKARLEKTELSFYSAFKQNISDFDEAACFTNLLTTNKMQQLSEKEKKELFVHAQQLEKKTAEICKLGGEIASQATKKDVIKKFSFDIHNEHKAIQTIANHLYASTILPKMTFPQAFFTNPPYQPKKYPDLDQIIATIMRNEQEAIFICCYHLDLHSIKDALMYQKNRNVKIVIITNQHQEKNAKLLIEFLRSQGILILTPKNGQFEQMHHKFFIFRCNLFCKPLVIMGSYNPTFHGNKNSWDDLMVFDNTEMIEQYEQRFAELTARSVPLLS